MRVAINLSVHQLRQADLADAHRRGTGEAPDQPGPADLRDHRVGGDGRHRGDDALLRASWPRSACTSRSTTSAPGYSSLAYLRKLPAAELKIDRSFVLDLETSDDARKIADAVVNLAQALNLKVVAEGVETEGQYHILRRLGCDQLQGFLFAKPMSAKALALWAAGSDGPRSIQFRESLFKETAALETEAIHGSARSPPAGHRDIASSWASTSGPG